VSEYKKELLKSVIIAIMSASLLGAITYHLFQPQRSIPIAFALAQVGQFSGNYSILEGSCLVLALTYLNGSVITSPIPSSEEMNRGIPAHNEYSGEFNASELRKITVSVFDLDGFFYNRDTDVRYLVTWLRDRIINVNLVDRNQKMIALGLSKSIGRRWNMQTGCIGDPKQEHYKLLLDALKASFNMTVKEFSSTGFWKATDYIWEITVNQLDDMLHGSGTTNITFAINVKTELKYRVIRTPEEDIIGNTTLSWAGTWGTLQLAHEEGKISWVKYDFKPLELVVVFNE